MRKEKSFSNHHILPKSKWWSSEDDNLVLLPETQHRAIHTLFENKMIAEQLIRTLDISRPAMREDVVEWLMETLTSMDIHDPYARYKDECIKF